MRIISGTARGRKLAAIPTKDSSIRPTADRAREALFSILGNRVVGCSFLDLFAGTGSIGLEAYSRGAERVVFVDNGHNSLRLLQKNISIFPSEAHKMKKLIVVKDDLKRMSFAKKLPQDITTKQFDIIFADPPYGKDLALPVLQYIKKKNLLAADGLIIIEERQNISLPDHPLDFELTDTRNYGEACFSFYEPTIASNLPEDTNSNIQPIRNTGEDQ